MGGNFFKTALLLTVLTVLFVAVGHALFGTEGMIWAFVLAMGMNFFSYWFSDKLALATSGAHEVSPQDEPRLYAIADEVARQAGLPRPRVYVIESDSPNAFATGRDPQHAAIAATRGIMNLLTDRELVGVLAHEMAHVRNRDTLTMAVVATVAGAISLLANMAQWAFVFGRNDDREGVNPIVALLTIIVAPIAATLIQLAISRSREYGADTTGASICHDPLALASALEKLERGTEIRPLNPSPSSAHLYIVNPFRGGGWVSLFQTHPPIPDRVARLRALAAQGRR
jgi:heat shock protein HtpX